MIFDEWSNFPLYHKLHPLFPVVQEFVTNTPLDTLPDGKHEIQGEDCLVILQQYQTKPATQSFIESHRKYLDIQLLLSGEEHMGITPLALSRPGDYDTSRDLIIVEGNPDFLVLKPGFFTIFHPQDAHMPGIQSGRSPVQVRKAVFKVALV